VSPQISGVYEEHLTKYVDEVASNGFSNFYIDIGANIGLSSSQSGGKFSKVICFEPNPLCVNVLKTNLSISLDEGQFKMNEYALGESDGAFDLYIPRHNWGGGFVRDHNSYSDDILTSKDGFDELDNDNYIIKTIQVKKAEGVFQELFASLLSSGLTKGVIKIDVEGFEQTVISALGRALPQNIELVVIFENWDAELNLRA